MSDSMIEKVGKALAAAIIADDRGNPGRYEIDYPWLEATDGVSINLDVAARAAIEAMREPTKEMTKLFDEADRLWCGDYPVNSTVAEMAWEMMTDAALKQKDPTP